LPFVWGLCPRRGVTSSSNRHEAGISTPTQVPLFDEVKSMEQGPDISDRTRKYSAQDPNRRILAHQTSRFTHYYFYVRDQSAGRSLFAWRRSSPSTPPTGSMVIRLWSRN
jgi:hypothetical protein